VALVFLPRSLYPGANVRGTSHEHRDVRRRPLGALLRLVIVFQYVPNIHAAVLADLAHSDDLIEQLCDPHHRRN